jgi:hypothetical protein
MGTLGLAEAALPGSSIGAHGVSHGCQPEPNDISHRSHLASLSPVLRYSWNTRRSASGDGLQRPSIWMLLAGRAVGSRRRAASPAA